MAGQRRTGRTRRYRFTDPDYIEPGWTVTIPTPAERGDTAGDNTIPVTEGDTLSQLAVDNHVPLDDLIAANLGRDPTRRIHAQRPG